MQFALALVTTVYSANAVGLDGYSTDGKSFSIGSHHQSADYAHPYGEELPGADFNRQVYDFNENKQIWDQNDYEERVKVEAELLVALEALKTSISYLGYDIHALQDRIVVNTGRIGANQDDIYENHDANQGSTNSAQIKVAAVQDSCRYSQHDLDHNSDALTLYCQQFAFAPEMNYACAALLSCRDKQLPYRYNFSGSYVEPHHDHANDHHDDHHAPQSSHGYALNVTGGHVPDSELPYGIHPEIAAAAYNPEEVILQANGESILVPIGAIDPSKTELACDEDGCVLIPDDGNPHNDIHVGDHSHELPLSSLHQPATVGHPQVFPPLAGGFDSAANYGAQGAFAPEIAY